MAKIQAKDPAAQLTYDEARNLISTIEESLEDSPRDLARLTLLLRWLAYRSTTSDRERLYIEIEGMAMPFMHGTGEAVLEQMRGELDALRKTGKR